MTAKDVLKSAAELPQDEVLEVFQGLADIITARFTPKEIEEINQALAEADAEFERGEGIDEHELRRRLGLA